MTEHEILMARLLKVYPFFGDWFAQPSPDPPLTYELRADFVASRIPNTLRDWVELEGC
jgi:hypothetical protein